MMRIDMAMIKAEHINIAIDCADIAGAMLREHPMQQLGNPAFLGFTQSPYPDKSPIRPHSRRRRPCVGS